MISMAIKLYNVLFKFLLKDRLPNRIQGPPDEAEPFGVSSRPGESIAAANPSFTDGVATKDIHINPSSSESMKVVA